MLEAHFVSVRRIWALVLRYFYLLRGSLGRLIDLAYWPTIQMVTWGLVTKFFVTHSSWVAQASGVLLGAVLLSDVLFRAQLGVSSAFSEELYSRNLGHLFASPLRPHELAIALIVISIIRTVFGLGVAVALAIVLFHYNLFTLGLPLIAFFGSLMMFGWAVGLVICALLLRYGLGYEGLAWAAIFALAPFSGIYYPIATLPDWAQVLAWLLPSSHVFEGMRTILFEQTFDWQSFSYALGLNVVYLLLATVIFLMTIRAARTNGALLHTGE
jgi:ABC-2 type transport system permease protein